MKNNNLNVVFAVLFFFGFIFFWESYVMTRYGQPHREPTSSAEISASPASGPVAVTGGAKTSETDQIVTLTAPGNKVIMVAKGARVGSWHLQEKDHWLEMLLPEKQRDISPLEMFPNLTYAIQKKSDSEAVFTATDPSGFKIQKTVSLLAQPPFHAVAVEITNPTDHELSVDTVVGWGNGLDKHEVDTPYDRSTVVSENRAVALADRLRSWRPGFIFGRTIDRLDTGNFQWVGVANYHFLAAIVAPEGTYISAIRVLLSHKIPPEAGAVISEKLKPGETLRRNYLLYVGPKEATVLKRAGHNLSESIDYGTFGFIAKGLLFALNIFDRLTGNYGWAIILLTLTIQILMFPLTKTSLKHTLKMKELQPHLKKLQEQYKDDPKRYQMEMMNFYRKNGMKFMGMEGCLPMLLQMPIFFAFYATLYNAYDLRGAHWILWIHDLAGKDPHYVLPILMGIGMFFQQKLSGAAVDPAQARMVMIMPVVFTFMFLRMPAGLVLYWVVNSLTTIVIQRILSFQKNHQSPVVAS